MALPRTVLLVTGGTLGMEGRRPSALHPGGYLRDLLSVVPELAELADVRVEMPWNLDSSNVGPVHWAAMAERIVELFASDETRGVVIIHGTDTMAYTASALSFLLRDLDRPVVLTGSQRPLREIRSDARMNLVNAVELSTMPLAEVCLCFGAHLFRGNRATKVDVWQYAAFESPNFPPLARIGLGVELSAHARRPTPGDAPSWRGPLDGRVACVRLTPGLIGGSLVGAVRGGGARGLVLCGFGSGNVPTEDPSILDAIGELTDSGVPVVIATQTLRGGVDLSLYECGEAAQARGALSAGDMTVEATVTKLMWALGQTSSLPEIARLLEQDLAGERTQAP